METDKNHEFLHEGKNVTWERNLDREREDADLYDDAVQLTAISDSLDEFPELNRETSQNGVFQKDQDAGEPNVSLASSTESCEESSEESESEETKNQTGMGSEDKEGFTLVKRKKRVGRKFYKERQTFPNINTFDNSANDETCEPGIQKPKVIFKKCFENAKLPRQATDFAAGYDLYSCNKMRIPPGENRKISFGFQMKLPPNICAKIYSRSGLSVTHGINVFGGVTIIDPDFYGPISVYLENKGTKPYFVQLHSRPVQMTFEEVKTVEFVEGDHEDFTTPAKRSKMGYGSTGGY